MEDAPTAVTVRLGGGPAAGSDDIGPRPRAEMAGLGSTYLHDGHVAEARWNVDEAARSTYDPAGIPAECAPNATLVSWAANSSGFAKRMGAAGLGRRFEALQALAVLRALNVTAARCEGRRDGLIAPLPAEPKQWSKYGVKYNQSLVEQYFEDLVGRTWRGLVSVISSYDRGNADREQKQVLLLFRGSSAEEIKAKRAANNAAAGALDSRIVEAERALEKLLAERSEL